MKNPNRSSIVVGVLLGAGLVATASALMGLGAAKPATLAPADTQYFVTADDGEAHLWLREGNTLTMVAHGECKECTGKGKEAGGHDGHAHKDGDGHDHGEHHHGEGDAIGTATIGAWTVAVSGEIKAGSEAHIDVKLSGGTAKPAAIRVWVGTQDGKGAMKQKADGSGPEYHVHADVPNPIPADAKLWIELDDGKGAKSVGGFAIKK